MTYPLSTSSSDSEDLWTSQTLKTKKVTSDLIILSQHPALSSSSASATLRSRLRNISTEMEDKIAFIQEKLASDVSAAAQNVVGGGGEEEDRPASNNTSLRCMV